MRTSNPILSREDAFTPGGYAPGTPDSRGGGVMTLDDVITKTGISMGVVVLAAIATFFLMPPALMLPLTVVAVIAVMIIGFVAAAKRHISPGLVLFFALCEGFLVGGISRIFELSYPGIVVQAVLGTFVAAFATLAAYKFFNIRVTSRFRKIVSIATVAILVALLLNFFLSLAGINLGLRAGVTGPIGLLPMVISAIAVVLAVLNLVLDFDYVERGIAMRAPANQSWKAAMGLTGTLVWLYVEILRIVSYFRR